MPRPKSARVAETLRRAFTGAQRRLSLPLALALALTTGFALGDGRSAADKAVEGEHSTTDTPARQRDIELALVLDASGSMGPPSTKLADLRAAADDLVGLLLPDAAQPGRVRIALAPFSAGLNAGRYFAAVTGRGGDGGCVIERGGAARFAETAATPTSPMGTASGVGCPVVAVQPLTAHRAELEVQIARLAAEGPGAGHIGAAWGWYLLSPRWNGIWPADAKPADYDARKTIKAVLMTTDGAFNTAYVRANGSSAVQARQLCANMKARGVAVYAVGYLVERAAERLLQDCASSPAHYFTAWDGQSLRAAFRAVGRSLIDLRPLP